MQIKALRLTTGIKVGCSRKTEELSNFISEDGIGQVNYRLKMKKSKFKGIVGKG